MSAMTGGSAGEPGTPSGEPAEGSGDASGAPGADRQAAIADEFHRRRNRRRRVRQVRGAGATVALAVIAAGVAYTSGLLPGGSASGGRSADSLATRNKRTTAAATAAHASTTTYTVAASTTTSSSTSTGSTSTGSTSTSSTSTSTTTAPPAASEPLGGETLIPGYRVVAFYGAPNNPALGVLGDAPPSTLWPRLVAQANAYAQPGVRLLPAYELIAFTAQGAPGPAGDYSARLSNKVISSYLATVRAHHGLLILDIQPGRGSFLADAKTLAPFLAQPDVALALDPEWKLTATQVPDVQIGQTSAASINAVSAWLSQLDAADHLPQKLLLIHQFTLNMVQDKAAVLPRSNLAMVFNMDGFGPPALKLATYKTIATDHSFPLGFKLFYQKDVPLLTPAQVLALQPAPSVVEYE